MPNGVTLQHLDDGNEEIRDQILKRDSQALWELLLSKQENPKHVDSESEKPKLKTTK